MTVKKADLVKSLMETIRFRRRKVGPQAYLFPEMNYVGLGRGRAIRMVGSLFEIIKETLMRGEDVQISGFGKFQVRFKWARKGRNPQSGEMIILRSRRVVTFRSGLPLRKKMNSPG